MCCNEQCLTHVGIILVEVKQIGLLPGSVCQAANKGIVNYFSIHYLNFSTLRME